MASWAKKGEVFRVFNSSAVSGDALLEGEARLISPCRTGMLLDPDEELWNVEFLDARAEEKGQRFRRLIRQRDRVKDGERASR